MCETRYHEMFRLRTETASEVLFACCLEAFRARIRSTFVDLCLNIASCSSAEGSAKFEDVFDHLLPLNILYILKERTAYA